MKNRARTLQRPRHVVQRQAPLGSSRIRAPLAPRVQEKVRKRVLERQVVTRQCRRAVVSLEEADPEVEKSVVLIAPRIRKRKPRDLA